MVRRARSPVPKVEIWHPSTLIILIIWDARSCIIITVKGGSTPFHKALSEALRKGVETNENEIQVPGRRGHGRPHGNDDGRGRHDGTGRVRPQSHQAAGVPHHRAEDRLHVPHPLAPRPLRDGPAGRGQGQVRPVHHAPDGRDLRAHDEGHPQDRQGGGLCAALLHGRHREDHAERGPHDLRRRHHDQPRRRQHARRRAHPRCRDVRVQPRLQHHLLRGHPHGGPEARRGRQAQGLHQPVHRGYLRRTQPPAEEADRGGLHRQDRRGHRPRRNRPHPLLRRRKDPGDHAPPEGPRLRDVGRRHGKGCDPPVPRLPRVPQGRQAAQERQEEVPRGQEARQQGRRHQGTDHRDHRRNA